MKECHPQCEGFTLFETLLYVVTFFFFMGGAIFAAHQIIQGSENIGKITTLQEEIGFVLRKIEWVLENASTATTPDPQTLNINTGNVIFSLDGTTLTLNGTPITTDNVSVDALTFTHIPGPPVSIRTELTLSHRGKTFSATSTKYLR